MSAWKRSGVIMLVVGIIVLVISLTADLIGIGRAPGMGKNQILGAIVGAIVTIVGLLTRQKK